MAVFAVPAVAYAAGTFTDVSSKSAYYKDVKAAVSAGVMAGCSKTKFCPTAPATRQDVARLANRLGALGAGTKPVANALTALTAKSALTANTAMNATNADHALTADSATTATTAASASNADHATAADSATTAATASNATSLGGVAASNFVQNAGEVLVGASPNGWSNFSSPAAPTFTYFSDTTRAGSASAGSYYLEVGFTTPTGIYGNQLSVQGLQLCYDAAHGATISNSFLDVRTASAGVGASSTAWYDGTPRSDAACRTYAVGSATPLTPEASVSLFLSVNFTANSYVDLASATLILAPSGSTFTPLSRPLTKGPLTSMKLASGRLPFLSH